MSKIILKKIAVKNLTSDDIIRIGNRAVRAAQAENLKLGLPNIFSRNGKIFYEMPDGEITSKSPF